MKHTGEAPSYRIDVHQHFWKYDPNQYDWITDNMSILKRDYLPGDFIRDSSGAGYKSSISVQARQIKAETDWLLDLAADNPGILGVVGWLNLCEKDFSDTLREYEGNPMLKGLRHVLQDEPDDDFMLRPDFLNGISCLGEAGLLYELLIFPKHLANAIKLVKMFPYQRFVLDHCAKPPIKEGQINEWADLITRLASFNNVSCKVSGLVTEADWRKWKPEDFYPYLDVIWKAFGPDRIMIGSDWPVCLVAATYPQVVCMAEGYFEKYGAGVLRQLTYGNPSQIYQL